jgi:hypothetical protein
VSTDHLAVTIALRVAIITTSIAGACGICAGIVSATSRPNSVYATQTYPSVVGGLALIFVTVMWLSITLSFLLYMSWRVRSATSGAASFGGFSPPIGPYSGANSRRHGTATYD